MAGPDGPGAAEDVAGGLDTVGEGGAEDATAADGGVDRAAGTGDDEAFAADLDAVEVPPAAVGCTVQPATPATSSPSPPPSRTRRDTGADMLAECRRSR